jgi:hypothetical protein
VKQPNVFHQKEQFTDLSGKGPPVVPYYLTFLGRTIFNCSFFEIAGFLLYSEKAVYIFEKTEY